MFYIKITGSLTQIGQRAWLSAERVVAQDHTEAVAVSYLRVGHRHEKKRFAIPSLDHGNTSKEKRLALSTDIEHHVIYWKTSLAQPVGASGFQPKGRFKQISQRPDAHTLLTDMKHNLVYWIASVAQSRVRRGTAETCSAPDSHISYLFNYILPEMSFFICSFPGQTKIVSLAIYTSWAHISHRHERQLEVLDSFRGPAVPEMRAKYFPWRNRLARSAVNRNVGGSSPPGSYENVFNQLNNIENNRFHRDEVGRKVRGKFLYQLQFSIVNRCWC
ncbi:unnamed protein product [Enterobius vermicularis]|uniref:Uncharacterized protein n=1 Tax=Enterobius vermicularis TaxID=51028 RepID=A0A0N4UVH6_ENTVE|nr:unnamed protein product [Enterobius vermicularis]